MSKNVKYYIIKKFILTASLQKGHGSQPLPPSKIMLQYVKSSGLVQSLSLLHEIEYVDLMQMIMIIIIIIINRQLYCATFKEAKCFSTLLFLAWDSMMPPPIEKSG